MRGFRTAGVGITLALTGSVGLAQQPAAKFGKVQGLEPASPIIRAQATSDPKAPTGPAAPMVPMPGAMPPAGATPPAANLGMPRPMGNGPSVSEIRGPVGGVPVGQPIPIGQPYVVGQPVPVGQPMVVSGPTVTTPSVLPGGDPLFGSGPVATAPAVELDAPLFGRGALGVLTGPGRLTWNTDLLLWWVSAAKIPPLVTTSALTSSAGIIGAADTRILRGDDYLDRTFHQGGKFGAVYWFGDQQRWGTDFNVFFLNRIGREYLNNSAIDPILARPFNNLNAGAPFSELVSAPGLSTGATAINSETSLWGAEVNLRRYLASNPCARLDGFVGFKYMNLSEGLRITESFTRTATSNLAIGVPTALSGTVVDDFRTKNQFYGTQIGLDGELRRGRWFLGGRMSVALGTVHQVVDINGGQLIQFTTGPAAFAGGLLTAPGANIGRYEQYKFGVLPEAGLKIGCHITPRLRTSVGYNIMYLNSVLRPGDQIDTGLDVTRIPNFPLPGAVAPLGVVRPSVPFRTSEVFAQGLSFTVQLTW